MLFRALSTVLLPKMVVPLHGRSIAAQDGDSFAWQIVLVEVYVGKGNTHVGDILSRMLFVRNFTSKAEDLILEGEHDEMVNC